MDRRVLTVLALLCALSASGWAAAAPPVIVLPQRADRMELRAAAELRRAIFLLTGSSNAGGPLPRELTGCR